MDNPKQKTKEEAVAAGQERPALSPQTDASRADASDRPLRLFEEAYYEYFKAIQDSACQALEGHQAAYQDYVQIAKEIHEEGCRRVEEAAGNYLRELQSAQESDNPYEEALKASHRFVLAQQTAFGTNEYLRLTEAQKTYQQTVTKLSETQASGHDCKEAFQNYLHALKKAWSQVDPQSLDVYALAAICNSILAVSSRAIR